MQDDKRLAQATVCRVYASVRHFARWAHKTLNPFPFGCPTDGVPPPEEPDGDWKGLTRQNELRLLSAARALQVQKGRGVNQGVRDHAVIAALLGTGLRVSELLGLDIDQWDERAFTPRADQGQSAAQDRADHGGRAQSSGRVAEERGEVRQGRSF